MRYDKPIFFQSTEPGAYDPLTGDYGDDTISEVKKYASVTDTGTETLRLVYGAIKQGSFTIRLQQPYKKPFDRIRIGEKLYQVDFARKSRAFVVSEVQ